MSQHGSPARSYQSYGVAGGMPYEERVGYFSVMDSSACKMPQSSRFKYDYEATPGPGYYDGGSKEGFNRTGGTIGRSQRFRGARGDGDEFLTRATGDTPGPASYNVDDGSIGRGARKPTGVVFGQAARRGLYSSSGPSNVGPGSYQPNDTSFSVPRSSSATFGRAARTGLYGKMEAAPGPGAYTADHPTKPKVRGGTFGRATRSTPGQLSASGHGTPGSGYYSSHNSTGNTSRGGTFSRAVRGTPSALQKTSSGSPGPGAYTPLYAVSSGNVRHR